MQSISSFPSAAAIFDAMFAKGSNVFEVRAVPQHRYYRFAPTRPTPPRPRAVKPDGVIPFWRRMCSDHPGLTRKRRKQLLLAIRKAQSMDDIAATLEHVKSQANSRALRRSQKA